MEKTIKNTAMPVKERLKGSGQIVIAGVVLALFVGVVLVVANPQEPENMKGTVDKTNEHYKHFAGLKLKEVIIGNDTYMLTDGKVTMLYIEGKAINEGLNENLPNKINREEALKIANEICGEGYVLERITENPFDFDILYKRYIGEVEVFGGDCYVVINSKTGKVGAYRKLVFDIPKLSPPKISKEEIKKKTGADANLAVIPHINKTVWMIKKNRLIRMFDADTGKEISGREIRKIITEVMKTDERIGNWRGKEEKECSIKQIDNNQGAVFRDDDAMCIDDIRIAERSMETRRCLRPPWDRDATNFGVVANVGTVNHILRAHEAVYYSGHGNRWCIGLLGNRVYCVGNVGGGLQARLFVISACYAGGNELGRRLRDNGVTCVIGASRVIYDFLPPFDICGVWAKNFWDRATGNIWAFCIQRTARWARIEANIFTWPGICNLDTEIGNCNIRI